MSKVLKLECINENHGMSAEMLAFVPMFNDGKGLPNRYWVAEITGLSKKYKYERNFLSCKKDYTKANSTGTRGIYAYYTLEENKLYEVKDPKSWGRTERYFCIIQDGELVKLEQEEVDALSWLKDRSG